MGCYVTSTAKDLNMLVGMGYHKAEDCNFWMTEAVSHRSSISS